MNGYAIRPVEYLEGRRLKFAFFQIIDMKTREDIPIILVGHPPESENQWILKSWIDNGYRVVGIQSFAQWPLPADDPYWNKEWVWYYRDR